MFAVTKYTLRLKILPAVFVSGAAFYGLMQMGLFSSNRDINVYYGKLYEQYKEEVVKQEYRGLKLRGGKKAYQVDNKEWTTSRFDELKQLMIKN